MTPLTGANREGASADLHTGVQARVYRFLKIACDKDRPENFPPTESREGGEADGREEAAGLRSPFMPPAFYYPGDAQTEPALWTPLVVIW